MDYFGYDPALLAYFQDPTMMAEDLRAAGIKYQPQNDIAVDPALQQFPAPVQQFNFVPANFFLGNQVSLFFSSLFSILCLWFRPLPSSTN